nr:uncharacterized protein LOC106037988 isoform X5 [Anser cygnoides]
MQRKKQACLPLSLMHSERTGGKQATNLVKENEKKQICISVKEECGVWSSVPANSSGIWVAGALAAWLGAMQTVDDAPEPAQRLTKLKFPKPSRNVMGTEEARSSWKAPRCWENGTSILTSRSILRYVPCSLLGTHFAGGERMIHLSHENVFFFSTKEQRISLKEWRPL